MDRSLIGKSYGPFVYEVGAEKIREFAFAIGGGVPSRALPAEAPAGIAREYHDAEYATARHGALIAPPTFCVNFAIKPFIACTIDPGLALDFVQLVHGEQAFEFPEPVRAGDVMTTTGQITDLFEKSNMDFVVMKTVSTNQHGREAVRATWTAVIRK